MGSLHRLSAAAVKSLGPGKHCDGGGLWLIRREDGGAQWMFRYTYAGRRREMGLGAVRDVPLATARRLAQQGRERAAEGFDPVEERKTRRKAEAKKRLTFEEVFRAAFEARKAELKNDGAAGRWDSPLRVHVLPSIGGEPIEALDQTQIEAVLAPIWHEKPEAARKALNRIRIVLRHGAALGLDVDLQAADKAKELLGAQRRETRNIPALSWRETPAFFASLDGGSVAERALRFLILTAARSGEVRGAHEREFDGDLWTLPAPRTKAGREHRVPLSAAAREEIEAARCFARAGQLFPGRSRGVISDMTMTAIFRRRGLAARPHGFRSSFRTWCAEATDTPREIAETCLAHRTAGAVEAAYRRTDYLEARRALMERWADHVTQARTT
ncbi:MAG: integrase arm-type DNA-binding domain-containing protein [Pseudomonadota bacterium]